MDVFRRKVKRLQCGGFGSVRIWTGSFGGVRVSAEKRRAAHDGLVADGDVEFGLGRDGAFEVGYLVDPQDGSADGWQGARLTYQTSLEQFRVELCYTQARAITLRCTSVNEGTVRHRQSKEASILRSHHEETRELRGERDNARNNNARRGRPCTAWVDNIKMWTGLSVEESIRMTEDRKKWRKYVHSVAKPRIEDG